MEWGNELMCRASFINHQDRINLFTRYVLRFHFSCTLANFARISHADSMPIFPKLREVIDGAERRMGVATVFSLRATHVQTYPLSPHVIYAAPAKALAGVAPLADGNCKCASRT